MVPMSVSADSTVNQTGTTNNAEQVTSISSLENTSSDQLAKLFGMDNTELVKTNKVQRGDTVTFDNFFMVGNDESMKSLSLVDPLNKNFAYKSAQVLMSQAVQPDTKATVSNGKDETDSQDTQNNSKDAVASNESANESAKDKTTSDDTSSKSDAKEAQGDISDPQEYKAVDVSKTGKFSFDKQTHTLTWKADKPSQFFGQLIDLRVTVKVNEDTDLNKIPNQSYMLKNDKKTKSDEVQVSVDEKDTPAPENHTPKEATPQAPQSQAPAPKQVTKVAAPQGSLPQTMQKIAKQHWQLIVIGLAVLGAAGTYIIKMFKNKKEGK